MSGNNSGKTWSAEGPNNKSYLINFVKMSPVSSPNIEFDKSTKPT